MARTTEKKQSAVTSHLPIEMRRQLEAIADDQGFDSASAYVRHLIQSDIESKHRQFQRLEKIFGTGDVSSSSQRTLGSFLRGLIGQPTDKELTTQPD